MMRIKFHFTAITSAALAILLIAAPVEAASRIQTTKQTCNAVQTALVNNGSAILRYPSTRKPGLTLYDRYVGDSRFCGRNEIGKWASVPAKDTQNCRVISCVRLEPDDLFPFKPRFRPYFRIRIGN